VGAEQLARMRPDAHLVNTARAACVDEAALVAALERGAIAGAALDVFWTEPLPRDHPLLRLAHVTITPHLAGAATDVVAHHTRMLCDDVARWRAGERPRHLANAAVWAPAD
jgi:D-3-phosphoglycerate dehydrogenase / 2-oxoglutarate reductase